jgi:hypothetical protein
MASQFQQNVQKLKCEGSEGLQAILQPYITPIPMNLWGRDLLQHWNAEIYIPTPYSEQSLQMMKRMGYVPGKGLGKNLKENLISLHQILNMITRDCVFLRGH